MKKFKLLAVAGMAAVTIFGAQAGRLYIIGDATPYGWSTDDATALLSSPADENLYTGTIYLKANQDFKFMTVPDFGNEEIGAKPGETLTDGTVALAKGTEDTGYDKIKVAEDANYAITINTADMTARIVKSSYQATQVGLCSMFMIGSATPGGWTVMDGTPLYQNQENPVEYKSEKVAMNNGSFKIATVLKGACSFDQKYYYFRNADDAAKMTLNQDGDLQWNIDKEGTYTVTANTVSGAIAISEVDSTGVEAIVTAEGEAEYFSLDGVKVANPENGLYIRKCCGKTSKVLVK